jgi:hypothetical protein
MSNSETIYREFSCAKWNFWTYLEGVRIFITERQFILMLRQGAKIVTVK